MKSFLNFIQYHNFAILIAIAIGGFGGSAFAATEVVKQLNIAPAEESELLMSDVNTSVVPIIDTSALLSTDLDSFDMDVRIVSVTETTNGYVVFYSFRTLSLVDTTWQEIEKENTLQVDKTALLGTDINTYAFTQLSEVAAKEFSYLKAVQANELATIEKGSKVPSLDGMTLDALADLMRVERELPEVIEEESETEVEEALVVDEVTEDEAVPSEIHSDDLDTSSSTSSELETSTSTDDGTGQAPAPVEGCTDSEAENYDSIATEDDDSCINPSEPEEVIEEPEPEPELKEEVDENKDQTDNMASSSEEILESETP